MQRSSYLNTNYTVQNIKQIIDDPLLDLILQYTLTTRSILLYIYLCLLISGINKGGCTLNNKICFEKRSYSISLIKYLSLKFGYHTSYCCESARTYIPYRYLIFYRSITNIRATISILLIKIYYFI